MENQENLQEEEKKEENPTMLGGLKSIGIGLVILGVAYYFFSTMTNYENGEEITMNSILLIAYKLLGKNISTGILALLGVFVGYTGVKELIASQKQ